MNGHAPFARGPTKGRGVRLDRIPRPGAATRLCLDPRAFAGISPSSFPVEAIQPAASVRAAGLAGRRAGRAHHGAKESEPPCGKVRPDHPTARPVDHRLFARSLWSRLQPASASRLHSQGRSGARLDNRATPASDHNQKGRDWPPGPTIAAPRRLNRDETDGAGKAAKEGQGSGRRPVQPAGALSAVPAKGRDAATST